QLGALDAPGGGWAAGDPPPREGNRFEVFVDGAEALPAIADACESAQSRVWLAGWHFTPELRMADTTLRELLAGLAERVEVRVLAWAGAPLPLFHPDRKEVREMRDRLVRGTKIVCALDDRERPFHCHHEKLVVVHGLVEKLRRPPSDDFRLVVVLPAHPKNGEEDTRGQIGVLAVADHGAGRFLACTLWQPGTEAHPVYVHAKIGIVDDRWLTIGSANLNEHSLFNDTEVNVVTHDPALARALRLRLWAEHLGCEQAELEGDPARIVDERWRPLAEEQLERRKREEPTT